MFALMLIFWAVGAAVFALLLTGAAAVIAAMAAGTSVALLVKRRLPRTLLLLGCGVLLLGGVLCLTPFMATVGALPGEILRRATIGICALAALLSAVGVWKARHLTRQGWKIVVTVLFSLGLAAAAVVGVLAALLP